MLGEGEMEKVRKRYEPPDIEKVLQNLKEYEKKSGHENEDLLKSFDKSKPPFKFGQNFWTIRKKLEARVKSIGIEEHNYKLTRKAMKLLKNSDCKNFCEIMKFSDQHLSVSPPPFAVAFLLLFYEKRCNVVENVANTLLN